MLPDVTVIPCDNTRLPSGSSIHVPTKKGAEFSLASCRCVLWYLLPEYVGCSPATNQQQITTSDTQKCRRQSSASFTPWVVATSALTKKDLRQRPSSTRKKLLACESCLHDPRGRLPSRSLNNLWEIVVSTRRAGCSPLRQNHIGRD